MYNGLTHGDDLPEQHAEGPHVGLGRVHVVVDGLGGHPPDRQGALKRLGDENIVVFGVSNTCKISESVIASLS